MLKLIITTLFFALVSLNLAAQEADPAELPGYIVYPTDDALQIETLTRGVRSPSAAISTENASVQYLALSPDKRLLALTTFNHSGEFWLEIRDLIRGMNNRYELPSTPDKELGYRLEWSPDSSRLLILPSNLLESPIVYDVVNQLLVPFNVGFALNAQWLDNNKKISFYGIPVCRGRDICNAFSDLYLAEYTDQSIEIRPVTQLDTNELIPSVSTTSYLTVDSAVYHPGEQRLYVSLGEAEINPGGFEFLYSTDFDGNLRFEADIAALDPESQFPTQIQQILYSQADSNLYLIVYTDGTGADSAMGRISVLRKTPNQQLTTIYSQDFNRLDQTTVLYNTDSQISPDGKYLAIGLSGSVQARKGGLIVLDLIASSVVVEQETAQQVCELFWSEDSSRVIYTQTLDSPCVRLKNQPVNQLVAYNLSSQTTDILIEDKDTSFFFLASQ